LADPFVRCYLLGTIIVAPERDDSFGVVLLLGLMARAHVFEEGIEQTSRCLWAAIE
jgi:hypothetical protein